MKAWYHSVFQASFVILIIQNLLILLSLLIDSVTLTLPYYLDLVGFGMLGLISLYYFSINREVFGIIASFILLIWVGIRSYFQFIVVENIVIDQNSDEFLSQIELLLSQASLFILFSGLLLFNYSILIQFSTKSNTTFLLIFTIINLISSVIMFWAFFIDDHANLEEQIGAASIGLVLKLLLVPILAIFAFYSMFRRVLKIFPPQVTVSG